MKNSPNLRPCLAILVMLALVFPSATATAQEAESQEMAEPVGPMLSDEAEVMLEDALAGGMKDDFALTFRPYFFPSLQGGTLTMIGFEIGKEPLSFGLDAFAAAAEGQAAGDAPVEVAKLELVAAILQDGEEMKRLGEPFTVASTSGDEEMTGVQSFGDTLAAGTYELVWGVRDTVSGAEATRTDTVQVPDYLTSGLGTSSVLLVNGQPQAAPGSFEAGTVYDGVRVLTVSFPAELDRVLSADTGQIMLTYIVVGAQQDAATRAMNIEITYRILTTEGESIFRTPAQTLNRPTVGQQIPIGQIDTLEAGNDYTFEITVKDLVAGTEAVTEVPFSIAG